MTNQEAFTKVEKHLLTQNKQASRTIPGTEITECRYRTEDGLKCALGCLIPDELYRDCIEGIPVGDLNLHEIGLAGIDVTLLTRLQDIHDIYPPEQWPDNLRRAASDYGLKSSQV